MDKWQLKTSVSKEELEKALSSLQIAIDKKDTLNEWFYWSAKTLYLVGKIVVAQVGYGPGIELLENLFGKDDKIFAILKKLLEETNA